MKKNIEIDIPEGYEEKIVNSDNKIVIEFNKINKNKEMIDFLKPFFNGLEIVAKDEYPNSVFYKKDGEVIFELWQDSKNKEIRYFYVDYYKIWSVFNNRFSLNFDETQPFIKGQVESTLKLGSVTPSFVPFPNNPRWNLL